MRVRVGNWEGKMLGEDDMGVGGDETTTEMRTIITVKKITTTSMVIPELERELHVSQKVPRAPEADRPGGQKLNSTHAPA